MNAIENIGDEPETRDNLINEVALDSDGCSQESAKGTVKNNSNVTVNVTVEVQFLKDGVLEDTGLDFITGLNPGQTATYEAHYFGNSTLTNCRPSISRVSED